MTKGVGFISWVQMIPEAYRARYAEVTWWKSPPPAELCCQVLATLNPNPNPLYRALGALVPYIVGTWGVRVRV